MPPAGTRNKWNNNFCGDTFQLPPSLHSMDPFFSEATSGRCSSSCSEDIPPFGLNPARQMIHVNLRANRQKNIISMKAFHVKKNVSICHQNQINTPMCTPIETEEFAKCQTSQENGPLLLLRERCTKNTTMF